MRKPKSIKFQKWKAKQEQGKLATKKQNSIRSLKPYSAQYFQLVNEKLDCFRPLKFLKIDFKIICIVSK